MTGHLLVTFNLHLLLHFSGVQRAIEDVGDIHGSTEHLLLVLGLIITRNLLLIFGIMLSAHLLTCIPSKAGSLVHWIAFSTSLLLVLGPCQNLVVYLHGIKASRCGATLRRRNYLLGEFLFAAIHGRSSSSHGCDSST